MKLNIMTKILPLAGLVAMCMLGACRNEDITEMDLAVNDKTLNLKAASGSTHVLVWCNSSWTAEFTEDVDWAVIEDGSGTGDGDFILKWEDNPQMLRRGVIRIKATGVDEPIDITINQNGEIGIPELKFLTNEKSYIAWETDEVLDFETNLPESVLEELYLEVSEAWVKDSKVDGTSVTFSLEENGTGASREAVISLIYEDIDGNLYRTVFKVTQTAELGNMAFDPAAVTVDSFEAEKTAVLVSNMGRLISDVTSEVLYEGTGSGWISDVSVEAEAVRFKVAANEGKDPRNAKIVLRLAKYNVEAALDVTQAGYQREYSFAELKAMLSSEGTITFDGDYITAVVLVDSGTENMETNTMVARGDIDRTVSLKTNYVQSTDGSHGLRIRMNEASSALSRGDKVKISLAGATLEREDNPVRYTLSGLTSNSFSPDGTSSVLPVEKTLSQLTDDDLYNWVVVKDVELAIDYGVYYNVNIAWRSPSTEKQNVAPRMLRDASNNVINMLINDDCPWKSNNNTAESMSDVPHGSGNVSGVLVHSTTGEITCYPDLGRYQIRPMDIEDIALSKEADSGFSRNLVVWYWPGGRESWGGSQAEIPASFGEGHAAGNGIQQTDSFMGLIDTDGAKAFRFSNRWWNTSAGGPDGANVTFTFSTKDVSGSNPVIAFASSTGNMATTTAAQAPVNWNMFYSLDGGDNVKFATVQIYALPASGTKLLNVAGSLTEVFVPLPEAIFGHDSVVITFEAADSQTIDWSTGEYTATAGQTNQYFRFGSFAVKYNK